MSPDTKCSLINSEKEKKKYSSRHDIGKAFVHRDFVVCSLMISYVSTARESLWSIRTKVLFKSSRELSGNVFKSIGDKYVTIKIGRIKPAYYVNVAT